MTASHASRLAGLVAATLVAAAGLVGLSAAPASAALCSGAGVNVVVDFNGLGGGVQKGCDPAGAGRSGDRVFLAAGFGLEYVRGSGFVCRVETLPGGNVCATTPPANAYWGLFWSDGRSGRWTYATTGVGGVSVPSGGFLAFAWQDSNTRHQPAAAPVNNQPAPTRAPTKAPTRAPTKKPTEASTKAPGATKPIRTPTGASLPATTAPAASSSAAARASATASASASPSAPASDPAPESDATGGASPDADSAQEVDGAFTPEEEPSGLPTWVPISVIVALAGAAGGVVWWRRRTGAA